MSAKRRVPLSMPLIVRWARRRARAAARAERWTEAANHYRRLLDGGLATGRDLVQLGHALKEADRLSEALVAYRRATELAPLSAHAHVALARLLRLVGRSTEADDALARAWIADPGGVDPSSEAGPWADGTHAWDRQLQLALVGSAPLRRRPMLRRRWKGGRLLRMARQAARGGDWATAERHYAALLAGDPEYRPGYIQLGHVLVAQGRDIQALHYYRTAALLNPHHAEAHFHAGRALARLGRPVAARAALLAAWRLDPGEDVEAELAALDPELTGELLRNDAAGDLLPTRFKSKGAPDLLPTTKLSPTATLLFWSFSGAVHAGR